MATHLELILTHPWSFVLSLYGTIVHVFLVVVSRILLPHISRAVTFRTEIARCVLGSFIANFWDLLFKAPWALRKDRYQCIDLGGVDAIVIPPGAKIDTQMPKKNLPKIFLLYAHGGGYMFGEPLMWISSYERWVSHARAQGFELIIIALRYRLSIQHKFPACRNDFITAYTTLLAEYKIPSEKVVFCGDSAGGGLVAMSTLQLRKQDMPLPNSMMLFSPWLDLTLKETLNSPALATDFLITFDTANPLIVDQLLPKNVPPDDPQVSPIFDDLKGLPPQILFAGTAEVLLPDSINWTRKSMDAGNRVQLIYGKREMHTYAMGWPICSITVQRETDKHIISFLKQSLT